MPKQRKLKTNGRKPTGRKGHLATAPINYGTWTEPQVIAQVVKYEKAGIGPDSPDVPADFRKVAFRYMDSDPAWATNVIKAEAKAHIKNRASADPGVGDLAALLGLGAMLDGGNTASLDDDDDMGEGF